MPLSLSGRIPASLGLLPDLVALTLSWNKLTGPIPESFGYFKKPIVLELDNNLLTGSVPQSMVRANMWVVNLSGNKLTGERGRIGFVWNEQNTNDHKKPPQELLHVCFLKCGIAPGSHGP
uniref:2-alkenal reductase (NAD(P)(+)) n=1 Tax=Opuntia streptacantha TaxID=393608 RepID=A0A7C8YI33_OPUST